MLQHKQYHRNLTPAATIYDIAINTTYVYYLYLMLNILKVFYIKSYKELHARAPCARIVKPIPDALTTNKFERKQSSFKEPYF